MELFRVSRNVYGQETLEGVSWDLLPVFAGVAVAIVALHLIYTTLRGLSRRPARPK